MPKKDTIKQKETIKKEIKEQTNAVEKINEKSIDNTTKDLVKKRLNKIHFEPLQYNNTILGVSTLRYFDFIYDDYIKTITKDEVKNYLLNLDKKMRTALNIRKILKDFEMAMYLNDNNANDDESLKNKLPRQIKMKRVEQMYDLLVDFSLRLLHNLFYVDLKKYNQNTYTIEECLKVAEPIILSMKDHLETQVNNELLLTPDEMKALNG